MRLFTKKYLEISNKDGIKGDNRVRTIDKAFEVIVEYLLTDTFSHMFYQMQLEDHKSDFFPDLEKFKMISRMSKYQIEEMTEKKIISDRDHYFHSMQFTDKQLEILNQNHLVLVEGKKKYKEIIFKLNEIRNDIAKNREMVSVFPKLIVQTLTHDQLLRYYEIIAKLKSENKFTLDNIFGFKRKIETVTEHS
mmetsp:Transcript_43472/g.51169  ORF Transcript_43472/g.51169 Transcript_43472/m.51169 type:complete len:192 (-) Transcript_43472:123-698(-)